MNSETKGKVLVFGGIGILVLIAIITIIYMVAKPTTDETEDEKLNLASSTMTDFSLEEMMTLNDKTERDAQAGSMFEQKPINFADFNTSNDYQEEDDEIRLLQQTLQNNRSQRTEVTNTSPRVSISSNRVTFPEPVAEPVSASATATEEISAPVKTNRFFRGEKTQEIGNTVEAVVHGEQTVTNKSTLKMRLLEDVHIEDGITISRGTYVYGVVSISEERISVKIESVRVGKNIYPFDRSVFDMDGIAGISVPENIKAEIAKKSSAQVIQEQDIETKGSKIGQTLEAVGSTARNVLSSAAQEVKVTIKSNYKIYLK